MNKKIKTGKGKYIYTDPRINDLQLDNFTPTLPTCYIVDIDGTVALINGRSPYDTEKCSTDKVNLPVARLIDTFMDGDLHNKHHLVYLTGRPEEFREVTEKWLKDNELWHNGKTVLLMRPQKDRRPDPVIKKELYDEHILGKYNVDVVFEDRDRNVEMFREELKLPVMQPFYGDF